MPLEMTIILLTLIWELTIVGKFGIGYLFFIFLYKNIKNEVIIPIMRENVSKTSIISYHLLYEASSISAYLQVLLFKKFNIRP